MDHSATVPLDPDEMLRTLETDDGPLRYYDVGEGPPLVLLHGSGPGVTGWRNFSGNLPTLARHFRCLILELPGFGVSHPTDQHPMLAAPRSVIRFLDGLDLARIDLIGNSMGGIVAAQVAASNPDRVRRLVTVGGLGYGMFSPSPSEGMNLLMDFTDDPNRERITSWLHSMVFDRSLVTPEMIEERLAQATDPSTLASARAMYSRAAFEAGMAIQAKSDRPAFWTQLHKVRCEALITWGRDDRVSPVDMATIPMRTMPRAELHVFPNCGHWVMIEQRAAWESAVVAFLTR